MYLEHYFQFNIKTCIEISVEYLNELPEWNKDGLNNYNFNLSFSFLQKQKKAHLHCEDKSIFRSTISLGLCP